MTIRATKKILRVTSLLVLSACGGGGTDSPPPAQEVPKILAVFPSDGKTNADPAVFKIELTFDKAMAAASINTDTLLVSKPGGGIVPGTVSYDHNAKTASFTPSNAFIANTQYTITVNSEAKDSNGVSLGTSFTSHFTTKLPTLTTSDVSIDENAGIATLTLSLNMVSGLPVDIDFATVDGTASTPADFITNSGTVTFAAGETVKAVDFSIVDDKTPEPGETYQIIFPRIAGAMLGTNGASITINDDDKFSTFLPVLGKSSSGIADSLSLVDIGRPSRATEIDAVSGGGIQVFDHGHFHTGMYDPSNFKISQFHLSTLIYSHSDELRRLDLADTIKPVSVRVSAEASASNICHETMVRGNDFVDQNNSRLVYRVGDCDKGAWHLVRLGMSAATVPLTPPVTMSKVVDGVYNAQTAALDGWIAVEGGFLKHFDADFALPGQNMLVGSTPLAVVDPQSVAVLVQQAGHTVLIRVDGRLLRYDQNTDRAEVVYDALGGQIWDYLSDGDALYFFVYTSSDGAMTLYRMPLTGTTPVATRLAKETVGNKLGWFVLTTDYLTYVLADQVTDFNGNLLGYNNYQVKMVHKTSGASPVTILNPEGTRGLVNIRGVGGKVYLFTMDSTMRANPSMRVIDETSLASGGTVETGYRFVGETYSDVFYPTKNAWGIKSLILQKDRQIVAFDPIVGANVSIGQLPAGDSGVVNFAWSRGHQYGLMTVANYGSDWGRVYYYDAERAGSLASVGLSDNRSINHKPQMGR